MKQLLILVLLLSSINAATIQLGVFKNAQNIQKLRKTFQEYNLSINKLASGVSILYAQNIDEKNLAQSLKKIKKIVPSAFVVNKHKVITIKKIII